MALDLFILALDLFILALDLFILALDLFILAPDLLILALDLFIWALALFILVLALFFKQHNTTMLALVTFGLIPRQITPGWMCGLVSLALMLGQVTPRRMRGLAIPGTIGRRTVVHSPDPNITSSVFLFRGTPNTILSTPWGGGKRYLCTCATPNT